MTEKRTFKELLSCASPILSDGAMGTTLHARGIRCVVAESFGDIFHANCFQNGVLPVRLAPREHTASLWLPWREAAGRCFSPSNAEALLLLPRFTQGAGT